MHTLDLQKRSVGQYLRILRKVNRLTLKEVQNLSIESGKKVSISLLSKIESGKILPTIPVLMVLSKTYDVRPKLLLEKLESENAMTAEQEGTEYDEARFNEFPHLDPKKIKEGLSLLKPNKRSLLFTSKNDVFWILLHTVIFLRKTGKLALGREAAELLVLAAQKNRKYLARSFFELAFIYKDQRNLPLALVAIKESERIIQKIKEPWFTPHIHHLKGNILRHLEKPKDAISAFTDALKKYEEHKKMDFKDEICKILNCLGDSYSALKKYKKARLFFDKALNMAREQHFLRSIGLALHNRGCTLYHENRFLEAIKDFQESNALAIEQNCQDVILGNYFYLMNSYEKLNDSQSKKACLKGLKYYFNKTDNILVKDINVRRYIEENLEIA
jgi:tetratricopeptide (TPR) repeat protein